MNHGTNKLVTLIPLLALLLILTLPSCSKNQLPSIREPQIYFEQPEYYLIGGTTNISMRATKPFATPTDVVLEPYSTDGKSTKEYTLQSHTIHFDKGDTVAQLKVNTKDFKSDLNLYINCPKAPQGYIVGIRSYTILHVEHPYYSFDQESVTLRNRDAFNIYLFNKDGFKLSLSEGIDIPIMVDKDQSTAIEGTNFRFIGGSIASFRKGTNIGYIKMEALKYEPNHNKIVIAIAPDQGVLPLAPQRGSLTIEIAE